MIFNYNSKDEDLKFVIYNRDKTVELNKSETTSMNINGELIIDISSIIQKIFELYGEECTEKKIAEFKRIRSSPLK